MLINCIVMIKNLLINLYMSGQKGESLLSNLSNLSNNFQAKFYTGSDFFKDSFLAQCGLKTQKPKEKLQIQVNSLPMSAGNGINSDKDNPGAFTVCWTNDGRNIVEGVSDDEFDNFNIEPPPKSSKEMSEKVIEEEDMKDQASSVSEQKIKKGKNQTKNIPKNFGKAIIIFVEKNRKKLKPLMDQSGVTYKQVYDELQEKKKSINTIADLREMWTQCRHSKCIRVISCLFLRKYSYPYIFNSRIKSHLCHVKYKKRLEEALKEPFQFSYIKDY